VRSLKRFVQESWLLIAASFFFGLLIAATNAALAPRIELNKVSKFTDLAGALLGEQLKFVPLPEPMEVKAPDGRPEQLIIYKAMAGDRPAGWVFRATGFGFADKIELVVAVDPNFQTIAGYDVLSSNETPGFGDQIKDSFFRSQFVNVPAGPLTLASTGNPQQIDSTIVAISGATISSTAVVQAFNNYLPQIKEQLQQKGLIGNGNES
jgi:electron transport complex protein RnfG